MLIYCLLFILVITQALSFYFIFNKIKPIIPMKGILLKPIPDRIEYEDVDKDGTVIRDIMETIKIEEWEVEIKEEYGLGSAYDIDFKSPDGSIRWKNKLGLGYGGDKMPYMRICQVISTGAVITLNREESPITNEIIVFLWDYIIKHHESINGSRTDSFFKDMKSISSKLKSLNRSRKLDQIL